MSNTLEQIKTIITDNINRENEYQKYHNAVLEVLKKYEGKKPTKRIANDLSAILPSDYIIWNTDYGMYHIKIWINKSRDNELTFLVGYQNESRFGIGDIVNTEKFNSDFDACHGYASIKRNESRTQILENGEKLQQIADSIDALNNAIKIYNDVLKYGENEDYFYINKLVVKKLEDHKKD